MKSLIIALVCFGLVIVGCYDVKPYRLFRKLVRRPVRQAPEPQPEALPPVYEIPPPVERPLSRRYR